jgi:hypothetical protein
VQIAQQLDGPKGSLEYGFRLQRMPVDRLPAAVNAAVWRRVQGANRPRLCKEELVRVEKHTRVNGMAVADTTIGYGQFKRVASEAARLLQCDCCRSTYLMF